MVLFSLDFIDAISEAIAAIGNKLVEYGLDIKAQYGCAKASKGNKYA